jgi:hypothetical protein
MTRAMALALIFATGPSLYAPAFAQVITGELQPAWTRAFDERIEWVAPLGDAASPTLVICTSAARLLLIDAETGTHHFVQPVQAGPGVRLADGEAPGVAYCYDRFSAYALSLSSLGKLNAESGPLLWQAGEWPLPAITTRDDPEFLTRLVAAQATSRGLLVARSDGRVALLAREDGHVPRVWHFPPLPDCRLHARDRTAALVFKAPGGNSQRSAPLVHDGVKVAFFDIDRARPEPTVQTLGDTWPIWTELIPGPRLIAVWPDRVVVTGPEGPALSFAPQNEATFRASTIAVCIPRGSASTRPATRPASEPPAFLITAHDAQLHARPCAYTAICLSR